jgi:hypothetical protein
VEHGVEELKRQEVGLSAIAKPKTGFLGFKEVSESLVVNSSFSICKYHLLGCKIISKE